MPWGEGWQDPLHQRQHEWGFQGLGRLGCRSALPCCEKAPRLRALISAHSLFDTEPHQSICLQGCKRKFDIDKYVARIGAMVKDVKAKAAAATKQ